MQPVYQEVPGMGCAAAAAIPISSLSPQHTAECTDEKLRGEETRSRKLCLLTAAAKIVLCLRENSHFTLFTVPSSHFSPQPKCPSFPLLNTFFFS